MQDGCNSDFTYDDYGLCSQRVMPAADARHAGYFRRGAMIINMAEDADDDIRR